MPATGIQLVPDGATPTDPYTLQNDLASTTPGLGASSIGVAPNGCFTSTNVQDALEEICAGGGGGPTTADQVSITDAGGYYTSNNVEGALQELGAKQGATNGIATLDAFGKIPSSQLAIPAPIYFEGSWDALTNTPDISISPNEGATWIVGVAGTTDLGGVTDWQVGDWAIFHDGDWFKIDNTASNPVSSVNGYLGAVVLTKSDVGLGNVENTALSTWGGSANLVALGNIATGSVPASLVTIVDAGGYYTSTDVEGALQELGVSIGSLPTWVGSTNVTTLGTVTTGVWHGTAIGDSYISSATYWNGKVDPSRTITTTSPLFGGGDLSADRTLYMAQADAGHDGYLSQTDWSDFASRVPQTRTINGYPLSGNVTVTKSDVGLGNVENTALSTWSGSTNITTLDTVTSGTWNATPVAILYGGTGQTTKTAAFNALSPLTTLGDTLYGGAAGTGTRLAGNTTATKQFLSQTGTGAVSTAPSWSVVAKADVGLANVENTALSTWVGSTNLTTLGTIATGTWSATAIAITRGGTGATTKSGGFDALSPMTTLGDIVYGGAAGTGTRLAGNATTTRQFLREVGSGVAATAPVWDTVTKTDVGLANVENTALSTWAGSTSITTLGTIATGTVPAVRSSITDAGNYFTSTTVEGALQEVGANLRTTFTGSAALNFNTTNSQSSSDLTMTVTGASTGDVVSLGVPTAAILPNSCYTAWVSATNTVTVRFNNYDNASQNPTSGTFNVIVTAFGGGGGG